MARGGSLYIFNVLCLIIFKVKYQNHCKQIKISCNKMLQVKRYRLYCLSCMIIQDLKIDDKRKIPVYFKVKVTIDWVGIYSNIGDYAWD